MFHNCKGSLSFILRMSNMVCLEISHWNLIEEGYMNDTPGFMPFKTSSEMNFLNTFLLLSLILCRKYCTDMCSNKRQSFQFHGSAC